MGYGDVPVAHPSAGKAFHETPGVVPKQIERELLKSRPALPEPEQFGTFWRKGLEEVGGVPADVRMEPVGALCNEKRRVFRISFATVNGQRIYGFLTLPNRPGRFPVLVTVPGAGPGSGPDLEPEHEAFAVLLCNVFPYETTEDGEENLRRYEEFNREMLYVFRGTESAERYFMRPVVLGVCRAVDWIAEQPFADAGRIGMFGSSQGGGLCLMTAGLNPRISAAAVNVPAFCDHGAETCGWPQFAKNGFDDETVRRMELFDAVHFARRIRCPVQIIAGLKDPVCPPQSVYAAFHCLKGWKRMIAEPEMAHEIRAGYDGIRQWLREKLKGKQTWNSL